jgi:3-dehydroquinate dehydratase/shikimate dehydrogenase
VSMTPMSRPQLCATVTAETTAELRSRRDEASCEDGADLVELRLDTVRDLDLEGALAGRTRPVLVTCRPIWEGGQFTGAEDERRAILRRALELGADWVDLEWRGGFEALIAERQGRNIVLSMHDFEGTPDDLEDRYRSMRGTGAEVVKMAVRSQSACDVVRLLRLGQARRGERLVLVGMGPAGVPTRLLPGHFGSCWTYAGEAVAPGQVCLTEMVHRYRFKHTSASTVVYGVAGAPIGHSLSPPMHNAAFEAAGLDAIYVPFEATDADDLMALADGLGVAGLSVTAPFKESILDHLREVDALGQQVGAVNTVRADREGWVGLNTDVPGFLAPLDTRGDLSGVRSAVLGAGGAARAVAVALGSRGAAVTVCARRPERATVVARLAGGTVGTWPPSPGSWDLLVNTTPVGTAPGVDQTPVPAAALRGGTTVYDLVYNPGRTRLLREAAAAGCEAIGGLDMLVAQAERQFEWWSGARPSAELLKTAALAALADQGEAESA